MSKPSTGARPLCKGSLREPGGGPQDPGPGEELFIMSVSSISWVPYKKNIMNEAILILTGLFISCI